MGVSTTAKRGDARSAPRQSARLQHEIVAVLLIASSVLVLLSLVSFSPHDTTFLTAGPSSGLLQPSPTSNIIGTFGANLAGALLWSLGGASYLLPFLLAMLGMRSFLDGTVTVTVRSAAGSVATVVALSSLLHLEVVGVPTLSNGLVFRGAAGGIVGEVIAGALQGYFASTGAHIIILTTLLVSLLVAVPVSMGALVRRVPAVVDGLAGPLSRLRERVALMIRAATQAKPTRSKPKPIKINRSAAASVPATEAEPERTEEISQPLSVHAPPEPAAEQPSEDTVMGSEEVKKIAKVSVDYALPEPSEHLHDLVTGSARVTDAELKAQSGVLLHALQSFGIEGRITEVHPGPVVTMYEFEPAPGVKVARIVNLDNDLALALKATSLRIVAPLPGKSVVGIEVPNPQRETVTLKEVVTSDAFLKSRSKLTLALGKDIFGKPVTADLQTMPHLLVAGATGAGKSVSLNSMLLSILFSAHPDEVKLLLIDPKMLEFQVYDGIPHLMRPVITNPKAAARGLQWAVQEMERRYKLLAEAGVRNIDAYNRWVAKEQGMPEEPPPSDQPEQAELPMPFMSEEVRLSEGECDDAAVERTVKTPPAPLPYIVIMIDELADLMMVAPKDVEDKIARLAQMARASGMHLVLATQRPSVDVLTGLIKANFPARIAFQVSSKTDSRTILDANGAEALVGRGDMLYLASGTGRLTRIHGSFVADDDVSRVVEFIKKQSSPGYVQDMTTASRQEEAAEEERRDETYEQAKDLVLTTGQASASLIQRRLRVGYPRAARMIERMEQDGIVGAPARDGRREVIGRRGPVAAVEE